MYSQSFRDGGRTLTELSDNFRQGMLVSYESTHSLGNELKGQKLLGMVMSSNSYIQSPRGARDLLICPLVGPEQEGNADLGVPTMGSTRVLRPDMCTSLSRALLDPVCSKGNPLVYGKAIVQAAHTKFMDLIQPIEAESRSRSFIGKGMFAWFDGIPRSYDLATGDDSVAVSLTPRAVAERTGVAMVCRGYTNFLNLRSFYDVPVLSAPGNKPFFLRYAIFAVSTKRLNGSDRNKPAALHLAAMRELTEKVCARLDDKIFALVEKQHGGQAKGTIPDEVQRALDRHALGSKGPSIVRHFHHR